MPTKASKGKITKDMKMGEVLREYPQTVEVFLKHGLHCAGCQAAFWESIEQGAAAHGIDVDKLLKDLNDAVKE